MASSSVVVKPEVFDGVNFKRWQAKAKLWLTDLKLFWVISNPLAFQLEIPETMRWKEANNAVLAHLLAILANRLFDVYVNFTNAKQLWDELDEKYFEGDNGNESFITANYLNYKMVEGRSVIEQLHELQFHVRDLSQYDYILPEKFQVNVILAKLLPSWRNFVTAISEGAPMFLRAINAEGKVKTKEYISEKLIDVIEEVCARSIVQVITDNATNCKGAGLIVEQKYTQFFWTPCVVHTLNLALKSICAAKMPRTDEEEIVFDECHWITEIAADANMIKIFIMNHGMRLSMFNEFSKLKLLAIAETRFASVVVILKRFCMIKRALQNMVISDKWETYRDDNRGMSQTIRDLVLNEVWWDTVNYIVEFTKPIYEMIRVADTDTPCFHLIYEMWDTMIETMKKVIYRHEGKEENEESTFYSVVQSILIDRWAKGNTPLHCLAHSLNPRYYSDKWINQEGVGRVPPHKDFEISQMRMKCFKKFFPLLEDLKNVKEEYARFSTCSAEFNDFDSIYDRWFLDPMNWWANHRQSIPVLQNLASNWLTNRPHLLIVKETGAHIASSSA